MSNCSDCFREHWSWRDCPGAMDWYGVDDIKCYCWNQVRWLIVHLELLDVYMWPPECRDTGYIGEGKRKNYLAPYIKIIDVSGELSARLTATGTCGEILIEQIQKQELEEQLYGHRHTKLRQNAKDAFSYIVGRKRRRRSLTQWLADRGYRRRSQII